MAQPLVAMIHCKSEEAFCSLKDLLADEGIGAEGFKVVREAFPQMVENPYDLILVNLCINMGLGDADVLPEIDDVIKSRMPLGYLGLAIVRGIRRDGSANRDTKVVGVNYLDHGSKVPAYLDLRKDLAEMGVIYNPLGREKEVELIKGILRG